MSREKKKEKEDRGGGQNGRNKERGAVPVRKEVNNKLLFSFTKTSHIKLKTFELILHHRRIKVI